MTLQADFDLPAIRDLAQRSQWVRWRREWRDNQPTKPPFCLDGKSHASSTNPSTWSSFEACFAFAQGAGVDRGVGFVFTADDSYLGVDLDGARDPSTGELAPWATDLVAALDSYTEISPSLTGVKVFCRAVWPARGRKVVLTDAEQVCWRRPALEVYDRDRYFAITGMHVAGTPATIEERQGAIDDLYETFFAATGAPDGRDTVTDAQELTSPGLTDEQVLELAFGAANGERVRALYEVGDITAYHGDDSRADLALVSFLGFYTGSDEAGLEQLDRLFRASKLYRRKWERADYRALTFHKALSNLTSTYHSERARANQHNEEQSNESASEPRAARPATVRSNGRVSFVFTPVSDLIAEPEEETSFLVHDLLPMGGTSMISAKPMVGKSTWARNLAHAVALGLPFLGREVIHGGGSVLYTALEEKRAEVAKHFRQMGTYSQRLFVHVGRAPASTADGLAELGEAIARHSAVLAIIDPLLRLVRVRDASAYAEMIAALEPLIALARQSNCHLCMPHHAGKLEREGGDAVLGSTALFGSVDTLVEMRRRTYGRTFLSIQRYGPDLPDTVVLLDEATGVIGLGSDVETHKLNQAKEAVLLVLRMSPSADGMTEPEIRDQTEARTEVTVRALRLLVDEGTVTRVGEGKRGAPYRYLLTSHVEPA